MLEVKNLYVSYGERDILKNISFSLSKGETISIIGPSGCGKSTLLLSIANLKENTSGNISNKFKDTNLILQSNGLFPWKTIKENIQLGLIIKGISKDKIKKSTEKIALNLNIEHILDKYPSEVSGGEKQRTALARALVLDSDLLLMDEPSSALDSINKENFQNILCRIQKEYNMSYIIVTHNIEEAVILGKRIAIMIDGEIKKIIENPYYGQGSARKSYEFFDKCNELRAILEAYGEGKYENV
jgi:ABC-type nitrate/sulfonate/bicarbonate transport system ATPase subunit